MLVRTLSVSLLLLFSAIAQGRDRKTAVAGSSNHRELPEVMISANKRNLLHILAYVREYSTLTNYSDTVFMFREKMVDYMLPPDSKFRYRGWRTPRLISSRSYYRFTDHNGLDSVSDRCNHHFSWSDWIGIPPTSPVPDALLPDGSSNETVMGRYEATETWFRDNDHVQLSVNVLADTTARKWAPGISNFFSDDIDFGRFILRFDYRNVLGNILQPLDLNAYSFEIQTKGRGHNMFMFHRNGQSFDVSTTAEVYILDKEFLSTKDAKKWEHIASSGLPVDIYEPASAPDLDPDIAMLVERVNHIDHDSIRLGLPTDKHIGHRPIVKRNAGQQILQRLKSMFGLDYVNANRKWNRQWKDFRKERMRRNDNSRDN